MLDGEDTIINRAIGGESSAFGLLYDHYVPKIYRFVVIRVGRSEEAEDITHQVFLKAWQRVGEYEQRGFPFSSWLYRIARNEVIDYYRTRKGTVSLEEAVEAGDPPGLRDDRMESQTDDALSFKRAEQAIRLLKEEYQEVIIMRFVEELSVKEVSAAIGKSEGAVKLIQHRATRELQKILKAPEKKTSK